MPRKLHLEPHDSSTELKTRYRASRDPVEWRRWHLLWLVSAQTTLTDAARAIGLNCDYARTIVADYNRDGAPGLRNRRKAKRPHQRRSLLTTAQLEQLKPCSWLRQFQSLDLVVNQHASQCRPCPLPTASE